MLRHWRLMDFAPGEGERAGAFAEDFDDGVWTPATAPGDTHRALQTVGRIADPYDHGGEEACRWVEDREWWWRATVEAAPARTILVTDEARDLRPEDVTVRSC